MPLGWIVPDGTNRTLEEIAEKKIANGMSPGGGSGAVIVSLPQLVRRALHDQVLPGRPGHRRSLRIRGTTVEAYRVVLCGAAI